MKRKSMMSDVAPVEKKGLNLAWAGVGLLVAVVLIGTLVRGMMASPDTKKDDVSRLTVPERISRHIATPEGEQPTITRIEDAEAMRQNNPTFYEKASNGDILAVWSNMAVLYSENRDIVISVLPLNLGSINGATEEAETEAQDGELLKKEQELVKIEVLNGTRTAGLAKTASDLVKEKGFTVLAPRDSKQKGYTKTLIFNQSQEPLPETMRVLGEILKAEVATKMPAGEATSTADVIVIVGSEYVPE